jgi:hypothetical protein
MSGSVEEQPVSDEGLCTGLLLPICPQHKSEGHILFLVSYSQFAHNTNVKTALRCNYTQVPLALLAVMMDVRAWPYLTQLMHIRRASLFSTLLQLRIAHGARNGGAFSCADAYEMSRAFACTDCLDGLLPQSARIITCEALQVLVPDECNYPFMQHRLVYFICLINGIVLAYFIAALSPNMVRLCVCMYVSV